MKTTRREFLNASVAGAAAAAWARPALSQVAPPPSPARPARIRFAAIGLNHSHINSQVETMIRSGGQLVSFFAKEPDLAAAFTKRFPDAKPARSENEILENPAIQLVVSAAVPDERGPLGIRVMRHGKDFMADKPAITTLAQLAEARTVQAETKRIFSVLIERHESQVINKAGELVKAGAIGRVLQTIGTAPHRMSPATRPPWFFKRAQYGGILCDLASHNIDAYLFLTGSTKVDIVASQIGNLNHPQYPELEDFGDVMLRGNGGGGYIRVDWFTPGGIETYGDSRLTILGTDGYMELRKNVDIGGRPGGGHLFVVDQKETRYVDCSGVKLQYGERLVDDVLNRTETAASQAETFLALELALLAEKQAQRVSPPTV
jgi:predicted dehydrogenase